MTFLTGPGCATCGTPVEIADSLCGPCIEHPPPHGIVHAVVAYDDIARAVVLSLKYARKPGHARTIARYLAPRLPALADAVLVPVPLHRWRIWQRGFNQSSLIAGAIAATTGIPAINALQRVKRTPPLKGLGADARARTLRGAIMLDPVAKDRIAGRTVYLIDDVFTSGATASACARVLKRGGAAKVEVACWARVIDGAGAGH